jgi:asparagine synthase (glutamine-hydrolysing)
MCGIYGIVDRTERRIPGEALLERMGRTIVHRGPDDTGCYFGSGAAIGMRRLSIIDLAGGHQPICNENETIWVVCNGEIYNFHQLRDQLELQGHTFRTQSDTEVLVHLYEQEGLDFIRRLRGMFAIAIWDERCERLVLVRDRIGKKPLYFRQEPHRLLFASEIKSILQDEDTPRRVDLNALREYLALGYVPAPATMFEGIQKLLPGHMLVAEKGRISDHSYWDIDFSKTEERTEEEWIDLIREKLVESVRIRLVSDVPLGAFLSGGIDSSFIVAAMAKLIDRPVKTYSIGFQGEDSFYNELPHARIVADAFQTDHHEIIVRPDVAELLPRLIWHLDEPIADSAFITTYLVSRLARESVTVILSGVGGDELFGGYRRYLGDGLRRYYGLLPRTIRSKWLPGLLARLPQDRHSGWKNNVRYATSFVKSAEWDAATRYESYVTVFPPELRQRMLGDPARRNSNDSAAALRSYFEGCQEADSLHQNIYVDLKTSLPDDLLTLTDKMTMAASLECRAPFLDHELIELTSRIPSNFKVRGFTMKYLLKKAVAPWLPTEILQRKKRGFGAPVGAWLRNDLGNLVQETLSPEQIRKRGFFDPAVVQEIIASHRAENSDQTDSLLALICFEVWSRIFLDGNDWQSTTQDLAVSASCEGR